ncbi:sensor domain-containing diguanylate cyclase [Acerihabitans arboris]|uniref:diguanylate cyclase n=1 Tax=Acerihabitans arboris TaxID=2691583 RepID=A0A845SJJ3_9GAMM|nr:sensor domain-containing diguanylate cyclase [Acerihabitans arboris]NDL64109.1 diguanylate cyclase [Acerihabitans arboris]
MNNPHWLNKTRAIILFTLMLLTAFLIISWSSYEVARQSLNDEIEENTLPLTSDNVYSEIQQDLLKPIFISSLMAHDTFVRDWVLVDREEDPAAMIRYLGEIDRRFDTLFSFFASDKTRRYYDPKRVLETISEQADRDRWYFQIKAMGDDKAYVIDARPDPEDPSHLDIFVNHKVMDYQGNFIGITGIGISVQKVRALIEKYERRYNRAIYFIDKTGAVVLHGTTFKRPLQIRLQPGLSQLATSILTVPGGSYQYDDRGRKVLLNTRLIPEFDWYLMVEQSEHPLQRVLFRTLIKNLGIGIGVSALFLLLLWLTIGGYQRRLEYMATTDKLTGIMNRQAFEYRFQRLRGQNLDENGLLSMAIIDIDHFKHINDRYGHGAGDRVIQHIAHLIQATLRRSDSVCRWGGDEFLVLLKGCRGDEALARMETLARVIEQTEVSTDRAVIKVTVSCGVAEHRGMENLDALIDRADIVLYQAKQAGRNQAKMRD